MARRYFSSIAQATTLSASCTSGATTLAITAAVGLPSSYPYTMVIDENTVTEELVSVTNRSGTTLTVTRGIGGTSGVAHDTGASIKHAVYSADFDEPNAFINGTGVVTNAHLANSSITINGSAVSLGGSTTITGETFNPFFTTF